MAIRLLLITFFIAATFDFIVVTGIGCNHIKFREKIEQVRSTQSKKEAKKNLQKHMFQKYKNVISETSDYLTGKPYPDQYLRQPLDHFDPQIVQTYNQRYWVNPDHWHSPDGPVFVYIGGEGALNSEVVQEGEHFDLAVKYGALIVAAEHRYYGLSIFKGGLDIKNLQYLSSQQALADLASVHEFISQKYKLSQKNTWISFGGSYPGALSAWFRIKYPHLVYGAIASSAPVNAQVNFEGYSEVVANSLSSPVVNGSAKCAQNVKLAFGQIDKMIHDQQFVQLSKDFQSCTVVKEERDIYQFVSNLADVFMSTVQYNTEMPGFNITTLCDQMTQANTPYENLRSLYKHFQQNFADDIYFQQTNWDKNCTDNTWAFFLKMITNTTQTVATGVGFRQWIYQTCTQFGYYQTCDPNTTCLFSRHMQLGMDLEICTEVFGILPNEVYDRVKFTNSYYGGGHPSGTRIVFVNGSIDPWHALSILKNVSSTETAIYINGTAHCANMGSNRPTDPPALIKARQKIGAQIGTWLAQAHLETVKKDTKLYFKAE